MDRKLLNLGICSYFLISYYCFQLILLPWCSSSGGLSTFRLFMTSYGTLIIMLLIGIASYRRYRKILMKDSDNRNIIVTAQTVRFIGGWLILATIIQPLAFALSMFFSRLNQIDRDGMIFFAVFLLICVPFIIIAGMNIKKSHHQDHTESMPNYVRNLCLLVLSYYLFFSNSCSILQTAVSAYQHGVLFSLSDVKWFSTQFILIGISLIMLFIAYKDIKSYDLPYQKDLSSQAFVTGGYLLLMIGIVQILNFINYLVDLFVEFDSESFSIINIILGSLPALILLKIGTLFIKIGNKYIINQK